MKNILAALLSIVSVASFAEMSQGEIEAGRQARSVHLFWQGIQKDANEVVGAVKVTQDQTNSYYMVIGFDGGYMGIQNVNGKHIGIFSVWDPVGHAHDYSARADSVAESLRAKVLYSDPSVHVTRFGGEGTGAKTTFFTDWEVGRDVYFRILVESDGKDRNKYTGFIGDGKKEMKIATISRLSHGTKPIVGSVYSFVEDFWRNVYSKTVVRRAEFTKFASRANANEPFKPCTGAYFSADGNKLMTIDAGPVKDGGFLQTGGKTENKTVPLWKSFRF